jgi:hypothetical protein
MWPASIKVPPDQPSSQLPSFEHSSKHYHWYSVTDITPPTKHFYTPNGMRSLVHLLVLAGTLIQLCLAAPADIRPSVGAGFAINSNIGTTPKLSDITGNLCGVRALTRLLTGNTGTH